MPCSLSQPREAGAPPVILVIYSTPCLFAAQDAIEDAIKSLKENDGLLQNIDKGRADVKSCTALPNDNLARRDEK